MDLLDEIREKAKKGERISPDEYAKLLHEDKEAFAAFMIVNNPSSLNSVLRAQLGYTSELPYNPDAKKITRVMQVILDRNNSAEIDKIVKNFKVDLRGVSPDLQRALKNYK